MVLQEGGYVSFEGVFKENIAERDVGHACL
jgi:hypothetical protein